MNRFPHSIKMSRIEDRGYIMIQFGLLRFIIPERELSCRDPRLENFEGRLETTNMLYFNEKVWVVHLQARRVGEWMALNVH